MEKINYFDAFDKFTTSAEVVKESTHLVAIFLRDMAMLERGQMPPPTRFRSKPHVDIRVKRACQLVRLAAGLVSSE